MTTVRCNLSDCVHNAHDECQKTMISMDLDGVCEDYVDYFEGPEYKMPYYKRIRPNGTDKNLEFGKHYKLQCFGKQFEVSGYVLYTEHDDREGPEECWVTEERTGYGTIYKHFVNDEDLKKIKALLPEISDVAGLEEVERINGELCLKEAQP